MKPTEGAEEAFGVGRRRIGAGPCYARPSMISAKYRLKEERRKVLKISVAKLRRIEDPESSLRRSVLINNTVRRLQREAREDKSKGQEVALEPLVLFCMPPSRTPPRMLSAIDDEQDEALLMSEARRRRKRKAEEAEQQLLRSGCPAAVTEQVPRREGPQFSCGHHAAMLHAESTSCVFHNLIASAIES
ncbi:uncharacterized protein LOC124154745 [Ischnura elegans]|uniref:uncharacterized protein LOC124154745 n=1 Tax=Ischnura elegans TaxID=197161 RepID=UPI001ED8B4A8|nr:uncharacterized protein LOC124154745 [Ischnura elegans]XP_046384607.1 uncharacterized protein LOC124154745 [Ischnura elegans]